LPKAGAIRLYTILNISSTARRNGAADNLARVWLAYCLRPAHALLPPVPPCAHLTWLPPPVLAPSVLAPSVLPKWRRKVPPPALLLAWRHRTPPRLKRGRGKGLGWSDDENLEICRAAAGVSQNTILGASVRQALYGRRIRAEFITDTLRPAEVYTQDATGGALNRRCWEARAGSISALVETLYRFGGCCGTYGIEAAPVASNEGSRILPGNHARLNLGVFPG
jgi:hypothetical protein